MKLVNVEDLKVLVAVESKGEIRYGKLVTDLFDDIPTVKAIPIEWIEKKAQEFLISRNFRWATDFQEVVDMWKVENNIPLFDGELKITLEKENE